MELVEDLSRKESTSDAVTLALRNRVMAMEATVGVVDEDSDLSLTLWDNVASMVAAKERSEAKIDIDLDLILGEFQTKFSVLEDTSEDGEEVNHRV